MEWPRAVVVHGWNEACLALSPGFPVTLLSGAGAALYGGVGWWQALVAAARAFHPETEARDVLDCADAPGAAMAALRRGQRAIVLDPVCPAFAAVCRAAAAAGGVVLPVRPPALDLADPGAARRLAAWLGPDDRTGGLG